MIAKGSRDIKRRSRPFDRGCSEMPSSKIYYCGEEVEEFGFAGLGPSGIEYKHGCGPWYDDYMARGGKNE